MRSRKFLLAGLLSAVFMVGCFLMLDKAIEAGTDLTALGVSFGGIAAGMGAVFGIYTAGNVKQKQIQNGAAKPAG